MYLYISILSFVAASIAEDNLFFDESPASVALAPSDNLIMTNSDLDQSSILGNSQSSVFDITPLSSSPLRDDPALNDSPEIWTALSDNEATLNLALDDCSSDQGPSMSKRHIRSRNTACSVKEPSVSFPESIDLPANFRDLAPAAQEESFKKFLCASRDPLMLYGARVPVCNSRIPDNTVPMCLSQTVRMGHTMLYSTLFYVRILF